MKGVGMQKPISKVEEQIDWDVWYHERLQLGVNNIVKSIDSRKNTQSRKSVCALCSAKIPKRTTHLFKPALGAWICQSCWDAENKEETKK